MKDVSKQKLIDFRECYNCQGAPSLLIQEFIHNETIQSDDDWKEYIEGARKHPSPEDLQKAKDFARKVMSSL